MNSKSAGPGLAGQTGARSVGRMRGRWLVVRVGWVAVALLIVALFVAGLPARYGQFRTLSIIGDAAYREIARDNLARLGLSVDLYAGYYLALGVVLAMACFAVAAVIFLRRSGEPMALFVAMMLVLLGATFAGSIGALADIGPFWERLSSVLDAISLASVFLFFFLFPDGRFVPRWTRWLAALYVAYAVPAALFPGSEEWPALLYASLLLVPLLAGLLSQIYRYRRVSTPAQRQQTKWVFLGFAAALAGYLGVVSLQAFLSSPEPGTLADLAGAGAAVGFMLLIPLSLGFSILRYRLWDIDLVINRTLVYGVLSALLVLVYSGCAIGLQAAFRAASGQDSDLAVVVSTLAVAALFVPLRRRTQATIDRRFYRKKYDAQKTLAAFSERVREDAGIEELRSDLMRVVQETLQPGHVSLWLRPAEKRRGSLGEPLEREGGGP